MNSMLMTLAIGALMTGVLHGQDAPFGANDPFLDPFDPRAGLEGDDTVLFNTGNTEPRNRQRERGRDNFNRDRFREIYPSCREKVADIFFILDSSSSIYVEDHYRHRDFVRDMVNQFEVNSRYTRVGALTFSDNYRVSFDLNAHRSKSELVNAINDPNIPYLSGLTNTASAIRYVRENVQFRQDITRVIVVFTDGYSAEPGSTASEADSARREGNYLFVIGVGQYIDEREWRAIASDPDDQFMYNFTEFRNNRLQSLLAQRICSLPPIVINRIQTCNVQRHDADIMFVAGANDAASSLPIISTIVDNIQAQPGQVQMSLQVSSCSEADNVPLGDPASYCGFGAPAQDFLTLLKRMRQNALQLRERIRNANQVAVLFANDATLLEFDRFELLNLVRDIGREGIQVYIFDLGDGSNRELERMARGNVFSLNDRFQDNAVGRLLNRICTKFNVISPFPTREPV